MTDIQQMFMLFYSILYGIMLNSLLGLGPFPIGNALAHKDLLNRDKAGVPKWGKGSKSCHRLVSSVIFLNILPFLYFAIGYQFLQYYSISADFWFATIQIIWVGLLSIGVFTFFNFFLCLAIGTKRVGSSFIYTSYERKENLNKRAIFRDRKHYCIGGVLYLLPLITVILARAMFIFS